MARIRTTCAYCGVGCGISAAVTGVRSLDIAGDELHPANSGRLCSKGTWLGETVGLEGRLLYPMVGERRVAWDHALGEVAAKIRQCISDYGPDSIAFYVSGQLLTEDYYVANKLMKGFIGSGNIDTNSRLCMASAVAAHIRAFGEDIVPCTYEDLEAAELVLLVGSNTAWCHPVIWQRIESAREAHGTKIVVIDPRKTETAERADLHVQLAPDGDIALFNALLAEMHRRGLTDTEYLADCCDVPEGFWDGLHCDPGIPSETFAAMADLVAANPRMVTMFSQGTNQSVCGTDKDNAIINLHLALGRIGAPGTGPFSITGQPNAMGGREVGGLATMLACHLGFSAEERRDVAEFWNAPNICAGPGLKAVDMFRAVHEGRIRFLWVMATNPAVSMPDAGFVREALARCETLVVSDVIAGTDTAKLAHIRLPALAWGEKDGTVTNSERMISRQRALFGQPGEARADWRIICDVAGRLGHGRAFDFAGPAAVFREYAAMTSLSARHGRVFDLSGWADCSDEQYAAMEPFRWGGEHPLRTEFPTPERRARLLAVTPSVPVHDEAYPLRLNTGRYRDQWHTMTRTGLSPKLSIHRREPLVEVSAGDVERFALEDGGLARISTPHGEAIYRVQVSGGQRAGEIFVPMHWTDLMGSGGRTGRLAKPANDPISGQPGFKNTPATLGAVVPEWNAFMVSRDAAAPEALYWTRSRIEGGWLTEIAGEGAIDADALLPEGQRSEVSDIARGMRRFAVSGPDGALLAALYVTRDGNLPDHDWILRQFAEPVNASAELLAGRSSQRIPDRGPLVCVCFDVGEAEVLAAIAAGSETVAQVGQATRAGTNCGSCRAITARLLEEVRAGAQEAAE